MHAYGIALGFYEHLCHDAVHDVFYNLSTSQNSLENIENIEAYLLYSMKNRLFDIYKNEKKKRINHILELSNHPKEEEMWIDDLINRETELLMKKEVDRLLKKIPSKHRKIILFRFNYNLKYDEIDSIMNMTSDAVKKQVYRSLQLMRQEANSQKSYNA